MIPDYVYGLVLTLMVIHHYDIHPELQGFERLFQVDDILNPFSHEFFEVLVLLLWVTETF